MGADVFMIVGNGKTSRIAFDEVKSNARYECGHGGYTGTIAEKNDYVMINIPDHYTGDGPVEYANHLIDECDHRVDDKWGPAGCISLSDEKYLFFGWASS